MKKLVLLAVILLSGCQAMVYGTASDFEKISLGMNKAQVVEKLGSPVSVGANADKNEESLIYKRMRSPLTAWPRFYEVTLRNDKVVKFGEQHE